MNYLNESRGFMYEKRIKIFYLLRSGDSTCTFEEDGPWEAEETRW